MNDGDPFDFGWAVDQDGYEVRPERSGLIAGDETEYVVGLSGRERRYQPLDDPALWRQFGETCVDRNGVVDFATKFGLLRQPNQPVYGPFGLTSSGPGDRLADTLIFAARVRVIADFVDKHQRREAMDIFNYDRPQMAEWIFWNEEQPEKFDYRWVPLSLRDLILHQIGEAITRNHQFRRCGNSSCPNWFRLGPHQADQSGRRQTTTVRRRFCSDYCRVAAARRQKRGAATHA